MKRNKHVEAAPSEAAPVAGTWTQTATEKILPLAQTAAGMAVPLAQGAAGRVVPLAQTAAAMAVPLAQNAAAKAGPLAQTAAAAAVPLAQSAVAKAGPLAQTAAAVAVPLATQAVAAVSPYATSAREAVAPYAHSVVDRVGPYAEKAADRLGPLTAGGAAAAQSAVGRVSPAVTDAYSKVGPALEAGRDRLTGELLPKVTTALGTAAASPIAAEALKRGRATVAAARGELSLPEPTRKRGSWVTRVAVLAAVAGVVTVVARRLLGDDKDSGWQAARPSAPYTPPTPATPTTAPATDAGAGVGATATDVDPDVVSAARYGEGAYVGTEPPNGYVIKGNEDSMKYHVPDGSGYHQTQAEVWFNSEEAAERAGFVRAQE